jgi:hypothetical protein
LVKQKESRTLRFYFQDEDGVAVDISSFDFGFAVQYRLVPTGMLISKGNDDFTNGGATGIASVILSVSDLTKELGNYKAELKATINGEIIKTPDFKFQIERSYTDATVAEMTVSGDPFWRSDNNPLITGISLYDENGVRWYVWPNPEGGWQRSQIKP